MEILIIGIVVILVFVGFECSSTKGYKRIIAKQERLINEQSDFIKVLEKDYNYLVEKQYQQLKEKINGK